MYAGLAQVTTGNAPSLRDQRAVLDGADAQHAVETFAHHVYEAVGAAEFDFELRMLVEKFRSRGNTK